VLPSEGGHTDFPTVDNETNEFFTYLLQNTTYSYISTERSFCGPTIPYIYKYFAEKYPE
jgi:glucokinase